MAGLNPCQDFYPWGYNNPLEPPAQKISAAPLAPNEYNRNAIRGPSRARRIVPVPVAGPMHPPLRGQDFYGDKNAAGLLPWPQNPKSFNVNAIGTNYKTTYPILTPWSREAAKSQVVDSMNGGSIEPPKDLRTVAETFAKTSSDEKEREWWERRVNALSQLEAITITRGLNPQEQQLKNEIFKEISDRSANTSTITASLAAVHIPKSAPATSAEISALLAAMIPAAPIPAAATPGSVAPATTSSSTTSTTSTASASTTSTASTLAPLTIHTSSSPLIKATPIGGIPPIPSPIPTKMLHMWLAGPVSDPTTPTRYRSHTGVGISILLPSGSPVKIPNSGDPPIIREDIGPSSISTPAPYMKVFVIVNFNAEHKEFESKLSARYPTNRYFTTDVKEIFNEIFVIINKGKLKSMTKKEQNKFVNNYKEWLLSMFSTFRHDSAILQKYLSEGNNLNELMKSPYEELLKCARSGVDGQFFRNPGYYPEFDRDLLLKSRGP